MPKGGKIGEKQYQNSRESKRRRNFPWKLREILLQKSRLSIVSEQIPPPAASASFRKLAVECTESSSDESMDPKGEIPEGYRLVSINSLVEFARRIHSNSPCSSGEIIICSFAIYVVFIIKCGSLLLFSSCVVITKLFL